MKLLNEVYAKYQHLDRLLSNADITDDFRGLILYDLWQAIKLTQQNEENREKVT